MKKTKNFIDKENKKKPMDALLKDTDRKHSLIPFTSMSQKVSNDCFMFVFRCG